MRFSNNTFVVNDYPKQGEHLVYSTRTQALIKIDQELKEIIDHFESPRVFREKIHRADDIHQLHQMGILVADDQEDRKKLKSFLQQLKYGVKKSSFPVTILTTYACNFKCTYCFQESSRTYEKMSVDTSEHAIRWLKGKIEEFGYEQLYLVFYGGEPLLNKPTLEHIAVHMRSWCEQLGVRFRFMLQTNGYLMTPELIDKYIPLGLDQVRISMDGVGHDHDRNRPLRSGGGTFEKIVGNIVACADKVRIGISTSYHAGDISPIERLLDYFEELGVLHKLGRFLFAPIHATLGPKGEAEKIRGSSCMCNYEDENLVSSNKMIRALMESKNLTMKSGLSTSTCPVTRDESGVTIDQHGKIYKCNSMLGHPELATGDVRDNDFNDQHREFVNLDVYNQCPQDCTYMPMCSGGCRLSSFLNYQNFRTPTCHKNFLNRMVPEFMRQEYESLTQKRE